MATFRGRFVLAVETVQLLLGNENAFIKKYIRFRLAVLELTNGAKKGLLNYGCQLILSQSLHSTITAKKHFDFFIQTNCKVVSEIFHI